MSPNQLIEMIIKNSMNSNNPVLKNAIQMYRNNNMAGLEQMARNLANEKGVNIDDLRKKLGM